MACVHEPKALTVMSMCSTNEEKISLESLGQDKCSHSCPSHIIMPNHAKKKYIYIFRHMHHDYFSFTSHLEFYSSFCNGCTLTQRETGAHHMFWCGTRRIIYFLHHGNLGNRFQMSTVTRSFIMSTQVAIISPLNTMTSSPMLLYYLETKSD